MRRRFLDASQEDPRRCGWRAAGVGGRTRRNTPPLPATVDRPGPVGVGAILVGSACRNAVASVLFPRRKWNNLRQYLREWPHYGSARGPFLRDPVGRNPLLRAPAPLGAHLVAFQQGGAGH